MANSDEVRRRIASGLARAMEMDGLSSRAVSEGMRGAGFGVSDRTVDSWASGSTVPKADQVIALCEVFGVPLTYFYGPEYAFDSRDLGGDPHGHRTRLRELRGPMTQEEFARVLGVSPVAYAEWEDGTAPLVDSVIRRVCVEHGCTASWLLGLDEDPRWRPREEYMGFPLVTYAPPLTDDLPKVPIPCQLRRAHTDLRAYVVSDAGVNRVVPVGSHVIVDVARRPEDGMLALVSVDGDEPIVRRVYWGRDAVTLATESWDEGYRSLDMERVDTVLLRVCGVVVWWQSAREMG